MERLTQVMDSPAIDASITIQKIADDARIHAAVGVSLGIGLHGVAPDAGGFRRIDGDDVTLVSVVPEAAMGVSHQR